MTATYAWTIDVDHLADAGSTPGTNDNAIGITGPRDAPADLVDDLKAGNGAPFRIYDDDGELYYSGRFTAEDMVTPGDSADAFGPLDDYGAPNAGATEIRYQVGGAWRTI